MPDVGDLVRELGQQLALHRRIQANRFVNVGSGQADGVAGKRAFGKLGEELRPEAAEDDGTRRQGRHRQAEHGNPLGQRRAQHAAGRPSGPGG